MPRKRIEWSESEREKVLRSAKEMAKTRKLPFNKHADLMKLLTDAQVVLDEHRRRTFYGLDSIGTEWLNELKASGIAPQDWQTTYAKKQGQPVDKNLLRINQLADERDAAVQEAEDLREQNKLLLKEAYQLRKELEAVPSEAQVVKTFIADILWDVESRRRAVPGPTSTDINKVVLPKLQEEPKPPRHEPEPEQGPRKPKLVVVGGRPPMHARIHDAMKDIADMRYVEHPTAGWSERFKSFKDPTHGRVVLWTSNASHQLEKGLDYHNIPYVRVGVPGVESLIDTLKQIAKEQSERNQSGSTT